MRSHCENVAERGWGCPNDIEGTYKGEMLCAYHIAERQREADVRCTQTKYEWKCPQPIYQDGLCRSHWWTEIGEARQMVNFVAWLDKVFATGELFYGRDSGVPHCPLCGLGAYLVDDQYGHRCTFCGSSWPYEEEERSSVRTSNG